MLYHPIPDEHLKEIGDMTVSFAALVFMLQLLAESLLSADQNVGRLVTAELSFKNIKALIKSLYLEQHGKDDDLNTLDSLLKRAGKVEELRNQITHSIWAIKGDMKTIVTIKTTAKENHGLKTSSTSYTAEDLRKFCDEIKQLGQAIFEFQAHLIRRKKASYTFKS